MYLCIYTLYPTPLQIHCIYNTYVNMVLAPNTFKYICICLYPGPLPNTLNTYCTCSPPTALRALMAHEGCGGFGGERLSGEGAGTLNPLPALPSPPERAAEAAQPPAPASHISVHHGSPPAAPRPQVLHRDRAAWDRSLVVRAVIAPRDPPPAYTPMPLLAHVLPAMRGGHNGLLAPLPFRGRRKW